jgi:hypothetical protein
MFRATFCPSSGALLNCSRTLRFPYKSQGRCVSSLFVSLVSLKKRTPARNTFTLAFIRKPESAVQNCSWWWAKCCPKHVEQRLNKKRFYYWLCIWLVILFGIYILFRILFNYSEIIVTQFHACYMAARLILFRSLPHKVLWCLQIAMLYAVQCILYSIILFCLENIFRIFSWTPLI